MKELIFGLMGGTALLMYGVDKMGKGLEKASGNMMKKMLSVLTGKVWSAFLVGTLLTSIVQSSTAVTLLTVGFVNAGLMKLPQALGVIYGANIGTTMTAQLIAFSIGFKLTEIALPVVGVGFAITIISKKKTLKNVGDAIMGFGLLFLGLGILNSGIPLIQQSETLLYFFKTYTTNPIIAILLGIVATALVHSSSATVGLVMVLAQAGLIDLQAAICIMLGDNIGTCVTAQLASMNANLDARRTAWGHTFFNIFGVLIISSILPHFIQFVKYATTIIQPNAGLETQIANAHTLFNLSASVIFLSIHKYFIRFLEFIIKKKDAERSSHAIYLDKLLLDTPVAAFKASLSEIIRGAEYTKGMVFNSLEAFFINDYEKLDQIYSDEDIINNLQKEITLYMVEVSKRPLSDSNSTKVPAMINSINNIERIGDHSIDICRLVKDKIDKNLLFSDSAIGELKQLRDMVVSMVEKTILILKDKELDLLSEIRDTENEVDMLSRSLSSHHIVRLEQGRCSIESGVIFLDIVNHLERIADHIYKVALLAKDELQGTPRNVVKKASK